MRAFPSSTPRWLLHQPLMLARWLAWHERLRRSNRLRAAAMILSASALLAGAIAVALLADRADANAWVTTLHDYWLLVLSVASVHTAMTVARRRRAAAASWEQSWLACAPLSATSVRVTHWIDAFAPVFAQYLAACGLLLLAAAIGDDFTAAAAPFEALTAGIAIGGLLALGLLKRQRRELREASRYAPSVAPGDISILRPSDRALSHWTVARAMATGRPENARWLFMFALSAMSAGTSAAKGLAILLFWAIAGYLASLLSAGVSVAREAAAWLRPTQLAFAAFAWPLARRAMLHQVLGTSLLAAGAIAAGSGWRFILGVCSTWLALVAIVYAVALWMSYSR